ncbi:MAG: dnaX2 [Candidatus Doudnabacteria bacterium]|nr:dnaX2 [Candidatus Doudnabacteria bacterium]
MWSAKGYENQKVFLDNALQNKKYSHAYLFCGPDNEAKKELAKEFAQQILGLKTAEDKKRINPDLTFIGEEKLKIEDIRTLISELSLKPFHYEYKVVIIESFENITDEASNSILKTLEEPNPSTILILLAKSKLSVLPTIASRCQSIYFSQLNVIDSANNFLDQLAKQPEAQKLMAIKEYAEKETADLQNVFEAWLNSEQQKMLSGEPKKYTNLQNLIEALNGLQQNLNKKLILEKLFLGLV